MFLFWAGLRNVSLFLCLLQHRGLGGLSATGMALISLKKLHCKWVVQSLSDSAHRQHSYLFHRLEETRDVKEESPFLHHQSPNFLKFLGKKPIYLSRAQLYSD